MKKIYIEPAWKMRREYEGLIENPPPGYEFINRQNASEGVARLLAKYDISYLAYRYLQNIVPIGLVKPFFEKFKRLPEDIELTYAVFHPVFRKQRWIMDMQPEQPHLMIGNERVFEQWKGLLRKAFLSGNCRKIICQLEAAREAFLQRMDCPELEEKTTIVPLSTTAKKFSKTFHDDKVKLLFINSANINAAKHFQVHGGLTTLEIFESLSQQYDNLELVMRSGLPDEVKRKYAGKKNIRIYDEILPWPQLEAEFMSADIFVYPTNVTPAAIFLDTMSYELPIVTTDVWGNAEIVADGETGFLVHHPTTHEFTDNYVVHFDSPEFKRAISTVPSGLVGEMAEKISLLIENPELRRKMGRAGRREVEHGIFSIRKRNEKLKNVFDEATVR